MGRLLALVVLLLASVAASSCSKRAAAEVGVQAIAALAAALVTKAVEGAPRQQTASEPAQSLQQGTALQAASAPKAVNEQAAAAPAAPASEVALGADEPAMTDAQRVALQIGSSCSSGLESEGYKLIGCEVVRGPSPEVVLLVAISGEADLDAVAAALAPDRSFCANPSTARAIGMGVSFRLQIMDMHSGNSREHKVQSCTLH